jgi:nucleoside 2-deoxyribosyltransferase
MYVKSNGWHRARHSAFLITFGLPLANFIFLGFRIGLDSRDDAVVTARKKGSDVIHSIIMNGLLDADLVVADLTEHNPNVLFELGMRLAEDKPVALIRAHGTAAIFDVDNLVRVEEYNPCLWPSTVEADIPKIAEHIEGTWNNRNDSQTYMKILRSKREQK